MLGWKVTDINRNSIFAKDEYRLSYQKDTIVKALPGTLGIMLFDTEHNANAFAGCRAHLLSSGITIPSEPPKIIRVESIGVEFIPSLIATSASAGELDCYYRNDPPIYFIKPPRGTVCYPAVKVLD